MDRDIAHRLAALLIGNLQRLEKGEPGHSLDPVTLKQIVELRELIEIIYDMTGEDTDSPPSTSS